MGLLHVGYLIRDLDQFSKLVVVRIAVFVKQLAQPANAPRYLSNCFHWCCGVRVHSSTAVAEVSRIFSFEIYLVNQIKSPEGDRWHRCSGDLIGAVLRDHDLFGGWRYSLHPCDLSGAGLAVPGVHIGQVLYPGLFAVHCWLYRFEDRAPVHFFSEVKPFSAVVVHVLTFTAEDILGVPSDDQQQNQGNQDVPVGLLFLQVAGNKVNYRQEHNDAGGASQRTAIL